MYAGSFTKRSLIRVALLCLMVLASGASPAATVSWTNPSGGSWNVGSNWGGGAVPNPGDNVRIDLSGSYVVTLDVSATVASLSLGGATTGVQGLLINGSSRCN